MVIKYIIMVDIDGNKEELTFDFDLEKIEEDGIYILMDSAIESHMQEHCCSCTFSESQNHCDCGDGYGGYEITDRKIINEEK